MSYTCKNLKNGENAEHEQILIMDESSLKALLWMLKTFIHTITCLVKGKVKKIFIHMLRVNDQHPKPLQNKA